jgi:hypothetical protein
MTAGDVRWAWNDAGQPESADRSSGRPVERLDDIAKYESQAAEASARLGDLLYEWARDWLDEQARKICPGRTCLLHGMEHEHTGRVRRDGR